MYCELNSTGVTLVNQYILVTLTFYHLFLFSLFVECHIRMNFYQSDNVFVFVIEVICVFNKSILLPDEVPELL
jgi:hypothetical protein